MPGSAVAGKLTLKLLNSLATGRSVGREHFQHGGFFFFSINGSVGKLQLELGFRQRHQSTSRSPGRKSEWEWSRSRAVSRSAENDRAHAGRGPAWAPIAAGRGRRNPSGPQT